jgi:hypothetical protein
MSAMVGRRLVCADCGRPYRGHECHKAQHVEGEHRDTQNLFHNSSYAFSISRRRVPKEGGAGGDPVWDPTVFCKNRDRLRDGDIVSKFFAGVLNLPQIRTLLSSEHFSVDGTHMHHAGRRSRIIRRP